MVDVYMCPFNGVGSKPEVNLRSGVTFLGEHTKVNPLFIEAVCSVNSLMLPANHSGNVVPPLKNRILVT